MTLSQVPDYCFGFLPLFVMYRIWQNQSKIAIAVAAPMDYESVRSMESDDPNTYNFSSGLFYSIEKWDYTLQLI